MRPLKSPPDCLLFTAILVSDSSLYSDVIDGLYSQLGKPIESLPLTSFDHSDYYCPEMGQGLLKGFLAFPPPFHPEKLADVKRMMRKIEWEYGSHDKTRFKRVVNIDPGYVNLAQVVLSTSKNFSHRIYLSDGVYAEVTLLFHSKGWEQLPWTYPDYKIPSVQTFLTRCRSHLKHHIDSRKS